MLYLCIETVTISSRGPPSLSEFLIWEQLKNSGRIEANSEKRSDEFKKG